MGVWHTTYHASGCVWSVGALGPSVEHQWCVSLSSPSLFLSGLVEVCILHDIFLSNSNPFLSSSPLHQVLGGRKT